MQSWSTKFPELPLAGFGFLLHFAWEMLQVPWFDGMLAASHGTVVWLCTRATFGDVVILLVAFWFRDGTAAGMGCPGTAIAGAGNHRNGLVDYRGLRMAGDGRIGPLELRRQHAGHSGPGGWADPVPPVAASAAARLMAHRQPHPGDHGAAVG